MEDYNSFASFDTFCNTFEILLAYNFNMENNYAFIDTQNIYFSVKQQGWRLDWRKFRKYLKDKYKISKAYLFLGFIENNIQLYSELADCGYILVFKRVVTHRVNNRIQVKGNIDAELVLHTMVERDKFSQAIIVSGDGDFYCLIDHLNKINKLKRVIIPNKFKFSALLKEFGNQITVMNDLQEKIKKGGH